jgi:urease accessory protein
MELAICAEDGPILLERFELEPASRPLNSMARLGDFLYFGAFYICRVGAPTTVWATLEDELALLAQRHTQPDPPPNQIEGGTGGAIWGVSRLPAHGLIVRAVAKTHRAIAAALPCFWRHAKQTLYGVEPVLPRKLY